MIKALATFTAAAVTAYELVTYGPVSALPFAVLAVVLAAIFWPRSDDD